MNLPTLITIPKADICKAEIAQIAQHLIDRINEGEVNPVEAHTNKSINQKLNRRL